MRYVVIGASAAGISGAKTLRELDNDAEIVKNPSRKILTKDELAEIQAKKGKNKNDYNLS